MRKNMLMLLAAALLVVTGCKKDDKDFNANGEKMTFTVNIDNGNDKTSITINGNEASLEWTEGDQVNINGKGFTATAVDSEGKATFEGDAVTPDAEGKYKAIFPANLYQGGNYVLPATQTYATGNNLSGVNPMYAESTTTELTFQSICALMKLSLKSNSGNKTIKKIEVSADQALSGSFTIEDNVAKLTSPNAPAGVTLDLGTGVSINNSTSTDFFIAIPAGEYTHLTFKAIDKNNQVGYYTSEGKVTVSANRFYTSDQEITFMEKDYLCLTAEGADAWVKINNYNGIECCMPSKDDPDWYSYEEFVYGILGDEKITLTKGEKVYFRNSGSDLQNPKFEMGSGNGGKIAASGNIMSLIDPNCSTTEITEESCFESLFQNCKILTTAPELPATTLAEGCYYSMFSGCTSLTSAPALPAESLASNCYESMFSRCTKLATAPELPATTLAIDCYKGMFNGCSALVTAPELKATELKEACYWNMFSGCSSLVTAPALPATTLAKSCYGMMFQDCTSLTAAPELKAESLINQDQCYYQMFRGCTNLNSVTEKFKAWYTDAHYVSATSNWLEGVSQTGTFYCPSELGKETGSSRIPNNWTIVDLE